MRAALALVVLVAAAAPARADERVLPAGSRVTVEGSGRPPVQLELDGEHFLLERPTVEALRAEAVVAQELEAKLLDCGRDVAQLAEREPDGWWTALKWGGFGAAIVTAFVAGLMVGH